MNRIVLRLFRRHFRRILFFALTIAVGIGFLFAIGNLLSTINSSIAGRARELLTADVVMGSWRPLPQKVTTQIRLLEKEGYRVGRQMSFPSMLRSNKPNAVPVLVSLKAIDATYPMYGSLDVEPSSSKKQLQSNKNPGCLIAKELSLQHKIKRGEFVTIGSLKLRVLGIIKREPDQVLSPSGLAPRVMMSFKTIRNTGLLRPGSRIRYNTLLALPASIQTSPAKASALKRMLAQKFNDPYIRITAFSESQPTLREVLRRTSSFFLLASLVALLLGAIGMTASVTAFLNEQLSNVGVLRCLGLGPSDVSRLYLRLCLGIGIIGGLGGVLFGYGMSFAASVFLEGALGVPIQPQLDLSYLLEGMVLAVVLAVGLNYAAIRMLSKLSPQGILRGQIHRIAISRSSIVITTGTVLVGLFLYTFKGSQSLQVASIFTAAMIGTILTCFILIAIGLSLLHLWNKGVQGSGALAFHLRHGLRQLLRQRTRTLTFLLALSIGLSLLGSLRLIQYSIVKEIKIGRANDIPNLFLIDIQPDQREGVDRLLIQHKAKKSTFNPLIRARLTHINTKAITPKDLTGMTMEARSRARFLTREYNLSYKDTLNSSEKIARGKFWKPGTANKEVSLEKRFANRIGVNLGDTLQFDIVGRALTVKVTSIRTINWASMMPNFFVVMPKKVLQPAPQIFIGSVNINNQKQLAMFQRNLVRKYSNISAIQLAPILKRVGTLMYYFAGALQALAWVCIGVGLLILAGTLHMGRNERRNKVAMMRTLGSQQCSILMIDVFEFLTIGALSGLIAVGVSLGLTYTLTRFLNIQVHTSPALFAELLAAAIFLPVMVGVVSNQKVYRTGVMENLRHIGG